MGNDEKVDGIKKAIEELQSSVDIRKKSKERWKRRLKNLRNG